MNWNWEHTDWPNFRYDASQMAALESRFLLESGHILGATSHVSGDDRTQLQIELLSEEAMRTSAIEGEVLDRQSVQSSLRRHLGLSVDQYPSKPREQGVAEMMVGVYSGYDADLSHAELFGWHSMLLSHDRRLETVGGYRQHAEPMQIVSGRIDRPTVHFQAPPSDQVPAEMQRYVDWFNGSVHMPALTRAGLAHLYFESIHPFEDGNGRIGRAISEKSLAQSIGQPSLIALAHAIEQDRSAYYDQLEKHQRTLEVTEWLVWFGQTVLAAQQLTINRAEFFIAKARFYDRFRDHLNPRQAKAVDRMFRAGPAGFEGGMSAENYIKITGASRATATRDLLALVQMDAFSKTGERRYTRYQLQLS